MYISIYLKTCSEHFSFSLILYLLKNYDSELSYLPELKEMIGPVTNKFNHFVNNYFYCYNKDFWTFITSDHA